ncbi:MAG: histone deacetylase, partial [Candidatus Thorarchaeota archaeon]|nr:histone deacetylase [Candidatus Thorarchaeota archaeon]
MGQDAFTLVDQSGLDRHVAPFPKPHMEGFENPLRIQMALQYLEENGVLEGIQRFKTPQANRDDALLVHSEYLVHSVELMSELGGGQLGESAYASAHLMPSAMYALGGALFAADMVTSGSSRHALALIRPPGHHATSSSSMGLCFFNNVAIATRSILAEEEAKRVSILDIDDHFGNGTAEIFYADPAVQFISLHEYNYGGLGIGHYAEIGRGKGTGTNINVPLMEESPDASYRAAMKKIVIPAIESFGPDIIAVSAGYDAHYADPIGDMNIDSETYWFIAKSIDELVSSFGMKGSFWVLEGGYNPLMLGTCIRATIEGLRGMQYNNLEDQDNREKDESVIRRNRNLI